LSHVVDLKLVSLHRKEKQFGAYQAQIMVLILRAAGFPELSLLLLLYRVHFMVKYLVCIVRRDTVGRIAVLIVRFAVLSRPSGSQTGKPDIGVRNHVAVHRLEILFPQQSAVEVAVRVALVGD
jgi:hypothetical protein